MSDRLNHNLRLGFVCHGVHARANLHPSIRLAGAKVHRVATRSMASAKFAASDIGAEHAHDSVASMLESGDLDAVFISVAPENHAELTLQCLQAGVHVFVEKPLGMTVAEASTVAEAGSAVNRIVMVGFMERYAPAYRQLATLILVRMVGRKLQTFQHLNIIELKRRLVSAGKPWMSTPRFSHRSIPPYPVGCVICIIGVLLMRYLTF